MAAFLLFCRTTEVSPNHFEARVFVSPAGEPESGLAARSECRIFDSAELAAAERERMAQAMEERLARSGHQVVRVRGVSPDRAPGGRATSSEPAGTP
jgi:hypothetical protein